MKTVCACRRKELLECTQSMQVRFSSVSSGISRFLLSKCLFVTDRQTDRQILTYTHKFLSISWMYCYCPKMDAVICLVWHSMSVYVRVCIHKCINNIYLFVVVVFVIIIIECNKEWKKKNIILLGPSEPPHRYLCLCMTAFDHSFLCARHWNDTDARAYVHLLTNITKTLRGSIHVVVLVQEWA